MLLVESRSTDSSRHLRGPLVHYWLLDWRGREKVLPGCTQSRNHCLNSLKKWKTEPDDFALESILGFLSTPGESAHTALESAQSFEQLCRVLRAILSPLELTVMTLYYVHDLTLPDITRRLMLSNRSGAKAHIVRVHRKLKCLVQECSRQGRRIGARAVPAAKPAQAA
jgi:hypothetical protein